MRKPELVTLHADGSPLTEIEIARDRLIAAAPDLLAALEQAREAMMHPTGHQSEWKDVQENKAIAAANAAIAKAKGEA